MAIQCLNVFPVWLFKSFICTTLKKVATTNFIRRPWVAWILALILSWQGPLSKRNQFIDLRNKPVDWSLYDRDLRHKIISEDKVSASSV